MKDLNTNSPKNSKINLGQLERAASRSEKAAVRNIAKKRKRSLNVGKMLNHPLYQRLEQAIISDEFKEALQRHGLTSAIEVASFKNYTALQQHVQEKSRQSKSSLPEAS